MRIKILFLFLSYSGFVAASSTKTFNFTSGFALQGSQVLLGLRQGEVGEENKNQLLIWDVEQFKVLQKIDVPEGNRDIIAIYPSRVKEEVFLLSQIRLAGSDKPTLWKFNLTTKNFATIQENIDCAEIKSVQAVRGRLDFQCGSDTPTPPKRKKFSLYVKNLESNKSKTLAKGLKIQSWVLDEIKKDAASEINEIVWKQGKGPQKVLKASEGL